MPSEGCKSYLFESDNITRELYKKHWGLRQGLQHVFSFANYQIQALQ